MNLNVESFDKLKQLHTERRLKTFLNHLQPFSGPATPACALSGISTLLQNKTDGFNDGVTEKKEPLFQHSETSAKKTSLTTQQLVEFIDSDEHNACKMARDTVIKAMMEKPSLFGYHDHFDLSRAEKLDKTYQQYQYLVNECGFVKCQILEHDYKQHIRIMEAIGLYDLGLSVKIALSFNFFAGSVINLGSKKHRSYLPSIDKGELFGSFAITEMAHGSNVRGIETSATYNKERQSFIIHTPNDGAMKWWIGNSMHATHAIIFAQLYLDDKCHGVNAFIVPIRDMQSREILEGVTIGDCGPKIGLNGLDNGFMRFNNVEIPRDNMLNRFADIDDGGNFVTDIKSEGKRFGAMLAQLTMGRCGLVHTSAGILGVATKIGVDFSFGRCQFGLPNQPEFPIMTFNTQKMKIIPFVAASYALLFAAKECCNLYANRKAETLHQLHITSAAMKALSTDQVAKNLIAIREACGGLGYSAVIRLGDMRNDHDITRTFEGDNVVLFTEVAKNLLTEYKEQMGNGMIAGALSFVGKWCSSYIQGKQLYYYGGEVTDVDYLMQLLEYRAYRLLETVAFRFNHHHKKFLGLSFKELRKEAKRQSFGTVNYSKTKKLQSEKLKKAIAGFLTLNTVQTHMVEAARAYAEREVISIFAQRISKSSNKDVTNLMNQLCALYALGLVQEHLSFYLEQGIISNYLAQQCRKKREELVQKLIPHIHLLMETLDYKCGVMDSPVSATNPVDPHSFPNDMYARLYNRILKFQSYGNAMNC